MDIFNDDVSSAFMQRSRSRDDMAIRSDLVSKGVIPAAPDPFEVWAQSPGAQHLQAVRQASDPRAAQLVHDAATGKKDATAPSQLGSKADKQSKAGIEDQTLSSKPVDGSMGTTWPTK